jgi:predicted RNase H-like HicB family nuclease/predicted RNA binding protein YcfA (HicA-like mRNA interferase family)
VSFQRRKIIQVLLRAGFREMREGGRHTILEDGLGHATQVPRHKGNQPHDGSQHRPQRRHRLEPVSEGGEMNVYHVKVERCEGWFAAEALEDSGIFTQGKTIDEVVENIREVAELIRGQKRVHIDLLLPADLQIGRGASAAKR